MRDCVFQSTEMATEDIGAPEGVLLKGLDLVDRSHKAPFTAGIGELWRGDPFDLGGDHEALVLLLLEGSMQISDRRTGEARAMGAGDVLYIGEHKGEEFLASTTQYGKYFFVTYPHWR